MPAIVKKIHPAINSDPQMLLGMLLGHSKQMKEIVAVVIWEDDSVQVCNTPMKRSDLSYCSHVLQLNLFEELQTP